MSDWLRFRGTTAAHPHWCSNRCRANDAALGEHRSDPVTVPVGRASVVGTRVAQDDDRQHLELRISIPLIGDNDEQRAIAANHLLRAITHALQRAISILTATTGSH